MVAQLAHPKTLASVTAHGHRPVRRTVAAAAWVLAYALAISFAIRTSGQPYLSALAD